MNQLSQLKNSVLNIAGGAVPALMGLAALPYILSMHGQFFLGIYMLQIAILYVVSLTDLGVSRVMTLVAFDETANPGKLIGPPFAVAKILLLKFSLFVVLLVGITLVVVSTQTDSSDIIASNYILLIAGVISVNTLPYRAVLELEGRFLVLNLVRVFSASAIYFAPLLFDNNTPDLFVKISLVLLCTRALAFLAYYNFTLHQVSRLGKGQFSKLKDIVFNRSKWVGLTNILSLGLTYIDRYIVVMLVSVVAVSSYTLATELSTKLWLITGAVMAAVNPVIARNYFSETRSKRSSIYIAKWAIYLGVVLPSIVFVANSEMLVELWLKEGFDPIIGHITSVLLMGIAINSLAQLNFSLLQLAGYEKYGAYLQAYGLIFLVLLAFLLGVTFGIIGIAYAFSIRLTIDAMVVSYRVSKETSVAAHISIIELLVVVISLGALVNLS